MALLLALGIAGCQIAALPGITTGTDNATATPNPYGWPTNKVMYYHSHLEYNFFLKRSIQIQEMFTFLPDGTYYHGCPTQGLEGFSLSQVASADCGTYTVEKDKLNLIGAATGSLIASASWAKLQGDRSFDRVPTVPVDKLSGTFMWPTESSHQIGFSTGGSFSMTYRDWKLFASGYTGTEENITGTYAISGNTLTFTRSGCEPVKVTIFTFDTKDSVTLIFLNGASYCQ